VLTGVRSVVPAALLFAVVAACAGGATPTNRSTGTPGQPTATAGSTATGGVVASAICRNLDNLTNLDYAFGKPFTIVQGLDAASKALTLQHLTEFAQTAPVELAPAAAALVGLWTDLSTNPSSVSESDPRWKQATDSINAWRAANC
jgi:hypothetical protein